MKSKRVRLSNGLYRFDLILKITQNENSPSDYRQDDMHYLFFHEHL